MRRNWKKKVITIDFTIYFYTFFRRKFISIHTSILLNRLTFFWKFWKFLKRLIIFRKLFKINKNEFSNYM